MKVGDIVYEAYAPKNLGKILSIKKEDFLNAMGFNVHADVALVRWTRPISIPRKTEKVSESKMQTIHLRLITELIENHEKTVNNHKKRYAEAKKL